MVLPVYNGEKYLASSIESILSQTYSAFELIIVNDCSTDSTESIIKKYMQIDNRIKYVKNSYNQKLPKSLNNGFAIAKGYYYTWTSDDNLFFNNALEVMVDYLEKNNVDLVYCDYQIIDGSGKCIAFREIGEEKDLKYNNPIGACFMYKSHIAQEIGGYDERLFLVEDYEYWIRISINGKIAPLHRMLYAYREHENSLTAKKSIEVKERQMKMLWKYFSYFEKDFDKDYELYDYFHYILSLSNSTFSKRRYIIRFTFKHPKYFFELLHVVKQRFSTKIVL